MRIAGFILVAGLAASGLARIAVAETPEAKEKPPLYTYVANWEYPRASWPQVEKGGDVTARTLAHRLDAGQLQGFGSDAAIIHTEHGMTHDTFFSGLSLAAVLGALDDLEKANAAPPVAATATRHWDSLYISRHYNWRAGTWKGAYARWSSYTLKPDAAPETVDLLARTFFVPMFEKLLAEGAIVEYEIDVETVHTQSMANFGLLFIAPTAEGLDKVNVALSEAGRATPLAGVTLGASVDSGLHRDELMRTTATYR